MSLKEIMERLSYDLKDPEIRAVQARLYREAIEGKLTVQTLQEHKTYLDMDIKTLSCLPCMEDYSIECFEEEEYMDNSEEHLQKQVDMIQSGSCGHTTDAMMGPASSSGTTETTTETRELIQTILAEILRSTEQTTEANFTIPSTLTARPERWTIPVIATLGSVCVILGITLFCVLRIKKLFLFKPRTSPVPTRRREDLRRYSVPGSDHSIELFRQ